MGTRDLGDTSSTRGETDDSATADTGWGTEVDVTRRLLALAGSPPEARYGTASPAHVAASASALAELAEITTGDIEDSTNKPLHVQLSHYEHGAFLSPLLYVFPILRSTGELIQEPPGPYLEPRPPAAGLRSPDASTPEEPFIFAIVVNHAVSVQLESVLSSLSELVTRQQLVSSSAVDVAEIDRLSAESDTRAIKAMRDVLRSEGWQAAAAAVRARAQAAGFPLIATYESVLLPREELARRVPILRRVYNELTLVRIAVDKLATALSQGLITMGGGSQAIAEFVKTTLDVASLRTYSAHLARDAFVCGNGYLSFGSVPDEDIRLLPPESTRLLDARTAVVEADGGSTIYSNILHIRGAEQLGSPYGVSVLEPFVQLQARLEVMFQAIQLAEAWRRPEVAEEHQVAVQRSVPLAERSIAILHTRAEELLGGSRTLKVSPPVDLYFPGHEHAEPAAEGISLVSSQASLVNPKPG